MADGTIDGDWPYVWRCAECAETFPGTGSGHWHIMNHAKTVHGLKPGECVDGLLDERSGEIVKEGCGTAVLQYCQRQGWIQGAEPEDTMAEEPDEFDVPDVMPPRVIRSDRGPTKRQMAELRRLELKAQQTGRVVLKDVSIDPAILMVFYEAQAMWPELYPDSSELYLGKFLRDAVIGFAVVADMLTVTRVVQSALEEMTQEGDMTQDGSNGNQ